jgi:HEAT repeat protein
MGLRKPAAREPLREVVEREHVRDVPGLLEQLAIGDADQRRWAARDLAGVREAVKAMGAQLGREGDPRVREALFTSLAATGGSDAVDALLPLLRTEDAQLRNGAIEALSGMPMAVAPRIAALLRDNDTDVRIFTVNLLGELRHAQVVPWLLQVLRAEREVNVVAAAIEVLAEVGGPEHVAPLREAAGRFAADPFIAFAADTAAQRIESA